jgi:hypothetical protein
VRYPPRVDVVPLDGVGFVESGILEVVPAVLVSDPSTVPDVQRGAAPATEEVGEVIEEVGKPKESHKSIHHFHTHAHSRDCCKNIQVLET